MSQRNKIINAIDKEPVYIKFSVVRQKRTGTASVSKGLREIFQESNVSFLEYGVDAEQNALFIRLNNEDKGSSILDKEGKPRSTITAAMFIRYLIDEDINLELSKPFFLQQISQNIFMLNNDATREENVVNRDFSIKWLSTEANKVKAQSNSFKNELWIKFYNVGTRQGFLRISKGLLNSLKERKMTHLEFGFNRETKSLFIRANNLENGIGLLNSLKEYKESHITISNILTHLTLAGINVEHLSTYFLHPVDNFVYEISTSEFTTNLNSGSIVWIPSKRTSEPKQIELEEERLNIIKQKAEERKERKTIIKKRKALKLEVKGPKVGKRMAEKLKIRKLKEGKLTKQKLKTKMQVKNPFDKLTFRFGAETGKGGISFSISKGFQQACIHLQATHIQFGITDNHIFLKATKKAEGISLLDSKGEYKGLAFGATYSLKEINEEVERLKLNKTYTLKQVTDLIYMVEDSEVPAVDKEITSENVVWLSNKPPLTLKKRTNFHNKDMLYFSNSFERRIKESRSEYLDVGYNAEMKIVALRLNDEGRGIHLRKEETKKNHSVMSLLDGINSVGIKMEYNVEYKFRQTSPNLFIIASNQEVVNSERFNNLFWLSKTLSTITKAKERLSKELKLKELKTTKEKLKIIKFIEDQANKQLFEKMSVYQKKGTNKGIEEIKKKKLTFKFLARRTSTYISLSKAFYNTCVDHQFTHFQLVLFHNQVFIELNNEGNGFSLLDSNGDYLTHLPSGIGASHAFNRINSEGEHLKVNKTYVLEEVHPSLFKVVSLEGISTQNNFEDNRVLRVLNTSPLNLRKVRKSVLIVSSGLNNAIKDSKETFIDVGYNLNKEIVAISLNSEGNGVELTCDENGCSIPRTKLLKAIESIGINLDNLELEFQQLLPNYFSLLSRLEVDSTDPTELSWLSQTVVNNKGSK